MAIITVPLVIFRDTLSLMWLAFAIVAALLVSFSKIEVSVFPERVLAKWGPLGVPRHRIPLHTITGAEAVAIRPMHAGGWGYRGSRVLFKQAALVVRGGPALRIWLEKGRRIVITVDDAARGATVLQDLLDPPRAKPTR